MTIRLLRNINQIGVANDTVTLNPAMEARLVSANNAVYVAGPDIGDAGVPVMGKTDPVTGVVINTIWNGTQAQYDAIAVKDANTLYVVV